MFSGRSRSVAPSDNPFDAPTRENQQRLLTMLAEGMDLIFCPPTMGTAAHRDRPAAKLHYNPSNQLFQLEFIDSRDGFQLLVRSPSYERLIDYSGLVLMEYGADVNRSNTIILSIRECGVERLQRGGIRAVVLYEARINFESKDERGYLAQTHNEENYERVKKEFRERVEAASWRARRARAWAHIKATVRSLPWRCWPTSKPVVISA